MKDEEKVDMEFERSVADEPAQPAEDTDRDPVNRERIYGGAPELDRQTKVDPEKETAEWERRYGSEESRDKLGFDGQ